MTVRILQFTVTFIDGVTVEAFGPNAREAVKSVLKGLTTNSVYEVCRKHGPRIHIRHWGTD